MKLEQINEAKFQTSYPILAKELPQNARDNFYSLVDDMEKYLNDGELIKAEFQRLKRINDYLEDAFEKAVADRFVFGGRYESLPDFLQHDILDHYISMHNIASKYKKAKAAQKKHGNHEALSIYLIMLDEIMPLHLAQKELKGMIVAKKAAQVAKANDAETEQKFIAGHKDVKIIRKVMVAVTKELHDKVLESNKQFVKNVIDRYWKQYDGTRQTSNYKVHARNPFYREIVNISVAPTPGGTKMPGDADERKKPKELDEAVTKYAQRMTDDILDLFINKQTAKLATIVIKKGNMSAVTLRDARTGSGVVEGHLDVDFADGSKFMVTNKVLWSVSKLGKVFHRFPTTFHNVVMPNGERMKGAASEARMNLEFAVI